MKVKYLTDVGSLGGPLIECYCWVHVLNRTWYLNNQDIVTGHLNNQDTVHHNVDSP